jgi:hypothetical protein
MPREPYYSRPESTICPYPYLGHVLKRALIFAPHDLSLYPALPQGGKDTFPDRLPTNPKSKTGAIMGPSMGPGYTSHGSGIGTQVAGPVHPLSAHAITKLVGSKFWIVYLKYHHIIYTWYDWQATMTSNTSLHQSHPS